MLYDTGKRWGGLRFFEWMYAEAYCVQQGGGGSRNWEKNVYVINGRPLTKLTGKQRRLRQRGEQCSESWEGVA